MIGNKLYIEKRPKTLEQCDNWSIGIRRLINHQQGQGPRFLGLMVGYTLVLPEPYISYPTLFWLGRFMGEIKTHWLYRQKHLSLQISQIFSIWKYCICTSSIFRCLKCMYNISIDFRTLLIVNHQFQVLNMDINNKKKGGHYIWNYEHCMYGVYINKC